MERSRNSAEGHKGDFEIIFQIFYLYCKGENPPFEAPDFIQYIAISLIFSLYIALSNLIFSFGSSRRGGPTSTGIHPSKYIRLPSWEWHRLQLLRSKTGDRKYEHEWEIYVNMNNKMNHVLVLDTINSSRNGRPMEAKRRWA